MQKIFLVVCFLLTTYITQAQEISFYPTNWWVNMRNPKLQLMVHGKEVGKGKVSIGNYTGVTIEKINKVDNPNYVFLDLLINSTAKPGKLSINIEQSGK